MYGEPSPQRPKPRSSSKRSTSSERAQRQSSPATKPTQIPPPTLSTSPLTTQPEQDVISPISPPVTTQTQQPKLHGGDLQQYPPNTLNNKYGSFQVKHGVDVVPTLPFNRSYSTNIEMNPNWRTRDPRSLGTQGSDIDFVQVVRSGTGDEWKTTAQDHGHTGLIDPSTRKPLDQEGNPKFLHRAELTEQQTGTGWRVDQTNYDTPFHGEAHTPLSPNMGRGRHHLTKENERATLKDKPAIAEPGYKFDAMSTAMNKNTGKEFGTVEWGFHVENEQGESILRPHPPTLLEDNLKLDGEPGRQAQERNRGRLAAYEQYNRAAPMKEQANIAEENRLRNEGSQEVRPPQPVTRIPRPRKDSTSIN